MAPFAFHAASVDFTIDGDAGLLELMRIYYARFPGPASGQRITVSWRGNECRWTGTAEGFLRVADANIRASATTIIVSMLLATLNPSRILLHGNALWHEEEGRTLILLGDSGAGKSTLTHELVATGEWTLIAEDTIVVDGITILPFPRASTLRGAHSPEWQPVGAASPTKGLQIPVSYCIDPVTMQGGDVVILKSEQIVCFPGEFAETIWVTHWDGQLLAAMHDALPFLRATFQGTVWRVEYAQPLSSRQRSTEGEILGTAGSMIIHARRSAAAFSPACYQRPPRPRARALNAREFLTESLHFLHSAHGRVETPSLGNLCLRLTRTFQGFHFTEFIPGGTVAESAAALERIITQSPGVPS